MGDETWFPPGFPKSRIPDWQDAYGEGLLKDGTTTFHIGQSYENRPASAIACAICGSQEFRVGRGAYFTGIKCPNCGWEYCIHNG